MKVLTDEVEGHPVLGFKPYAECLVDIIRDTNPRFSIGIYGKWGSGKTTLMKLIEEKLKDDKVLTIWFNAWRYEREQDFAITALMKTIAYAMGDHPIYREVKPVVIRSLKIIPQAVIEALAARYLGDRFVDYFKKRELSPLVEFLAHFDKETIYFDGISNIEEAMKKILDRDEYQDSKVVIFIDDLDRCSPKRALEVFESVKVFLDIKGFVFVIGLSHETIAKLIEAEYKESEIKGEEYIRKIIQIPFILPNWNQSDSKQIIENLLNRKENDKTYSQIDEPYSQIIKDNMELIASVVEPVPREVKRFINSFLISYKIFSETSECGEEEEKIKPKELLLIQAIQFRWYDFYTLFISDEEFRRLIKKLVEFDFLEVPTTLDDKEFESELREKIRQEINEIKWHETKPAGGVLKTADLQGSEDPEPEVTARYKPLSESLKKLRRQYKDAYSEIDADLWRLMRKEKGTIFEVQNWEIYRRATEISKEIPTQEVRKSLKTDWETGEPITRILGPRGFHTLK
jgi:Cdc6-like AAA superfamily ATPase